MKIRLFFLFSTFLFVEKGLANDTIKNVEYTYYYESISNQNLTDLNSRSFDSSFQTRYSDGVFQYEPRVKQYSQWEQFKQWVIDWLERIFKAKDENAASRWFDHLINIISVLLIIIVVYFIVKAILNNEGSWIFGRSSKEEIINHINVEEKIHQADFQELIRSSKTKKDYRLTIRYYYLWVLRTLSDRKIVNWDINKTNSDYQYEIRDLELRKQLGFNCYLYDYIWYGEFDLDEQSFRQAETKFKETLANI